MPMPSVETYLDYRTFLRDWFQAQKAMDRRFSHRRFAARAGFTSTALVPLLVRGERNLTERYIEGFIDALGLHGRQEEYFRKLVDLTHAKTDGERRKLELELVGLRRKGPHRIDTARIRFYESWIHVAIYHALMCLEVDSDLESVRQFLSPSPSKEDIRESISLLRDLSMIRKDKDGCWKAREMNLLADGTVGPWVVREFQAQMFALGSSAHDRFPSDRRKIGSETLSVGSRTSEEILRRFDAFRREIVELALADTDTPQEILQWNFQLFPLNQAPSA